MLAYDWVMTSPLALAALADPTRRTVYELLAAHGPASVSDLASRLPVSRPAVSQHLRTLLEAGLVSVQSQGTRRVYAPDAGGLAGLSDWLNAQWDAVLDQFQTIAEQEARTMATPTRQLEPVIKTRTVPLPLDAAFDLFTQRIREWWPVRTHSIGREDVVDVRFEGQVGGRVTEVMGDGTEHSWADVLAWDPPHRFVLSWHPAVAPAAASRLEVRFVPVPAGTEVLLRHDGWEEFGEQGSEHRGSYDQGWELVLGPFVAAAEDASARR